MKFTDGAWCIRKGFNIHSAAEVRTCEITEDKVRLLVPSFKIYNRGMTLGGVFLTMEITSPFANAFSVKVYHHKGDKRSEQSLFKLNETRVPISCSDDGCLTICSGDSRLVINKEDFSMTLWRGDKKITASEGKALAYIDSDNGSFMREQLSLRVGEHVYGFGEHFGSFIKNGQVIEIWNEDGGTFSEQAYKNIPFYITDNDLGVFVDHSENVSFEIASENVSKVQFSVEGEYLRYFLFAGDSMKDVLSMYTKLTGRVPKLPEWSYGLWLSTSFLTDYDEDTVLGFIDGMLSRGIDLKVFHFDCFWMEGCKWCNFLWDKDMFPDPAGLIKKIHDRGIKVCVWINPYIAQESELFDEGAKNGYFIKKTDGNVWQTDLWQPGMAIVDFTDPDALKWFQSKLRVLLDMGVDCFKTDFGERIPFNGVEFFGGQDPKKMHNFYTYLYNEAVYELLKETKGEGEAVLFARSATAGGQKFPVHWGGDCKSDYVSMEQTIRGGLSLMLSGFSFWSHDIGGFEDKSTPDVYKRWAAFGLMSSHSRLHGSSSYRVPWNYDEEASEVVKYYTDLKKSLLPYILKEAQSASENGVPLMRPMVLEFQDDPVCATLDRQYMLGSEILVAPVFDAEGMAEFYLPAGRWQPVDGGDVIDLPYGRFFREKRGYKEMPVYRKL